MNIIRNRFVVMRKNRSEIWCGLAKRFYFKPVSEVNDTSVKTYRSESQAESGCSSWDRNFEVVPAKEIIVINPMSNADRIRAMSDEELAKCIYEIGFDCHLCSEHERLSDSPFLSQETCDDNCFEHCLEWLQEPVKEDS